MKFTGSELTFTCFDLVQFTRFEFVQGLFRVQSEHVQHRYCAVTCTVNAPLATPLLKACESRVGWGWGGERAGDKGASMSLSRLPSARILNRLN